jgi:ABC-type multidrug transport system ATPase subunit
LTDRGGAGPGAGGDGAPAPRLAAQDVEVRHGRGAQAAVSGVSLTLGPGEGLLVTGPAGSGKTSLLRGLLGLAPAGGTVRLLGGRPGDPAALRRVGYAPQGRAFAAGWRAGEVVAAAAAARGAADPHAAAEAASARAGLTRLDAPARALDAEDARRLTLACALTGVPELIVLDDPFEFPEMRHEVTLARERGAAVLVACADPGNLPQLLGRTLTLAGGAPA